MYKWTEQQAKSFYKTKAWQKKRNEILRLDHNECQHCKAKGKYTKATMVHHVHETRQRPDLRLDTWHQGERQLLSLCFGCHEKIHDRQQGGAEPLTPERW